MHAGLAEGHGVALLGHLTLDPAVEVLVLEVEDGVRVLNRLGDEALGVGRSGRADNFQPGDVGEARLRILGVEGAARETAARGEADGDGHRRAGAVALLGGDGHQVVPRAGDEVGELHLGDRAHAHDRRPGAASDDRRLRERRIDHPPLPELLLEALRDLEGSAVDADVLTDDEDALVALHLLPEPVRDCL